MPSVKRFGLLSAIMLGGCPKDDGAAEAAASSAASAERAFDAVSTSTLPDGTILVQADTDGNGKYDVFDYYLPREDGPKQLVRKEVDLNGDERVDATSFFDEDGRVDREEMDRDFDGRIDWIDRFDSGRRAMSEVDGNGDGRFDTWTYYEGTPPRVTRRESDKDGNELVDLWEKFDESGNVTRTGRDLDGDGKMDVRDE